MNKIKKIVLVVIVLLLIGVFAVEVLGNNNLSTANVSKDTSQSTPNEEQSTASEEEAPEVGDIVSKAGAQDSLGDGEVGDLNLGEIVLDDTYTTNALAYVGNDNTFDWAFIIADRPVYGQEYSTICSTEPDGQECQDYKLSISLSNVGLYLTCENTFPSEKWALSDEQYNNLKLGYDNIMSSGKLDNYTVTGSCPMEYIDVPN